MRTVPVALAFGLFAAVCGARADEATVAYFRFDSASAQDERLTNDGAKHRPTGAGPLTAPAARENAGSLEFDGTSSIVRVRLGERANRLKSGFTWEGFFFSPAANQVETDGAIADRFVTQFVQDKPGSTRLTVGLAAVRKNGPPVLCIAMAGSTNRHDGQFPVEPDAWHHFAVVHKGEGNYGKLLWYLDYELEGEVTLDGKSPRTTLQPAGDEPLSLGARLKDEKGVNRGFRGLLDEMRLSSRPLEPQEFLRAKNVAAGREYERPIAARIYEDLPEDFNWDFARLEAVETIALEAFGFSDVPAKFSHRGYRTERRGATAIRTAEELTLPAGDVRFLLRTSTDALFTVDGRPLIDARLPAAGHPLEKLPEGPRDHAATFTADGKPHTFALSALYDAGKQKAELRDVVVCYSVADATNWRYLGHPAGLNVSPATWARYRVRAERAFRQLEPERRQAAVRRGNRIWDERHAAARTVAAEWNVAQPPAAEHPIDFFIDRRLQQIGGKPAPLVDDAAFLRRVSLDLRGRIPTLPELRAFLGDDSPGKRQRVIDQMLASDEWADSWVGYWQDVLAENPSILKPTLNNSGPFRRWIYESFRRNLPMDRFATELILMEGDNDEAGTAGFAQATLNDAPMAMKAHVVMQAFLAVDLACARCHDSPVSDYRQRDLFSLAAMLNERPLAVPQTSVVPPVLPGGRKPIVTASLKPGQSISPAWTLDELISADDLGSLADLPARPRARLAETITSPRSTRFSDVIVNRTWRRYMGVGLIEPVDSWTDVSSASHPELLRYLSWRFVEDGYDMKKLARLIVTSRAYQRAPVVEPTSNAARSAVEESAGDASPAFAAATRRRMTGEQLVDSLHVAVGRDFDAEELTFDPNRTRGFLNLGVPRRAWQLTSMSNERDRPALSMPVCQSIVDVLGTFGWRETRPDPRTVRDHSPNPLQPLMLANGLMSARLVRLTEESAITELCLEDGTVEELAERMFLAVLSRNPSDEERAVLVELLRPGFEERRTGKPKPKRAPVKRAYVDWDKHLNPEATLELMEAERLAREGPPPTVRLREDFRQRAEDALWSLINSPEFVFVP